MPFDAHGIEPIPAESRDSTPAEQFWIWFGANLAPINWVLGALGIALGLSLLETVIVVAVGNVFGCALFGLFNVIGHRTAVNQMVLGRAPFGRRGGVVPGVIQCLLTMAWVGVNTWVVLDLALGRARGAGRRGRHRRCGTPWPRSSCSPSSGWRSTGSTRSAPSRSTPCRPPPW